MKRLFDIIAAAVGLLVLLPVIVAIAIAIRYSSPGPALFIQMRLGRNEQKFRCYKFRTMTTGAPEAGSHEVSAAWITPIGRRLRARKLDELPQLYNVLRGDMSLVGPRPNLPNQTEVIAARRRQGIYQIRPGITGSAQLALIDMSTPQALANADREYLETQSFYGDLIIMIRTALGRGAGDAVRL